MLEIPTMLTIKETAQTLHLPEHFIRTKVLDGTFISVNAGNKYLVNIEKALEYLNTNKIR